MKILNVHKINILGVTFDNITFQDALDKIFTSIEKKETMHIITANIQHIVYCNYNSDFKRICDKAHLVIPDGFWIMFLSRLLGKKLKEKISGSDFMPVLCHKSALRQYKIYLMGGRPGSVEKTKFQLESENKTIKIVGTYCPPYGFLNNHKENDKIIRKIKEASPDILIVGLSTPLQDEWINNNIQLLNIPVNIGVGATFEFIAKVIKRAPIWMQNIGLEWIWRILIEPRRLLKRYITNLYLITIIFIKYLFKR